MMQRMDSVMVVQSRRKWAESHITATFKVQSGVKGVEPDLLLHVLSIKSLKHTLTGRDMEKESSEEKTE